MALEACMPEIVSRFNSQYRRPRKDGDTTLAAHWDGTYRDRFFHAHAFYPPTQKPSSDLKWSAKHRKEN